MDPNETLAELRKLAARLLDTGGWPDDMAEKFQALDEWLSKGGFLPTDWQANR